MTIVKEKKRKESTGKEGICLNFICLFIYFSWTKIARIWTYPLSMQSLHFAQNFKMKTLKPT